MDTSNIKLYPESNERIADLLLLCEDNAMCIYAGTYIKSLEEQLNRYKGLEEQGKLLKLPCAVGDTIFRLCAFENDESEIIEMKVGCVEPFGALRNHKGVCEIWNVYAETNYTKEYFKFFDFGKTVFLTKKEAETALNKLQK